jgi:hypothetical protein
VVESWKWKRKWKRKWKGSSLRSLIDKAEIDFRNFFNVRRPQPRASTTCTQREEMAPQGEKSRGGRPSHRPRRHSAQTHPKSLKRKRDEEDIENLSQRVASFDASTSTPTEFKGKS